MSKTIEIYADPSCPFAHVGLSRLVAGRAPDIHFRVRAWPLELVNGEALDPATVARKVKALREQVAPDLFEGFSEAALGTSMIPAMALENAAYELSPEVGERVSIALRERVFEDGEPLDEHYLNELAGRFAVTRPPVGEAHKVVQASWDEGKTRGVIGSPHFFTDRGDYFCPSLQIHHEGDELVIKADVEKFEKFVLN